MKPEDGGAAFGMVPGLSALGMDPKFVSNLTVRDWFAGQALAGICVGDPNHRYADVAKDAYATADAMLQERAKVQS